MLESLIGWRSHRTGLPRWSNGKESICTCRRHRRCGFDPWVEKIPWNRKWQPIPVFLPGRFHGQRSLVGYTPWACKELDMTEHAHTHAFHLHGTSLTCRVSYCGCQSFAGQWTHTCSTNCCKCFSLESGLKQCKLSGIIFPCQSFLVLWLRPVSCIPTY